MPTDPYQKIEHIAQEDVARRVFVPRAVPDIFLLVGPCRSGTTAQAKVFRAAGMLSHHQPLKSVLRCLLQGQEETYTLPEVSQLLMRETLGPYTLTEAAFDPLAVLLKAGVPREKLHLILMVREPLSTLASWQEHFSFKRAGEILVNNCIEAYRTTRRIQQEARSGGLSVLHYVYEALRDNDPASVNEKLFSRLGMKLVYKDLNWQTLAPFASTDEHESIPTEPAFYAMQGLQTVRSREAEASGLTFAAKPINAIDRAVALRDVAGMSEAEIPEIYETFRKYTENDLSVSINQSHEISDYQRRHAGEA